MRDGGLAAIFPFLLWRKGNLWHPFHPQLDHLVQASKLERLPTLAIISIVESSEGSTFIVTGTKTSLLIHFVLDWLNFASSRLSVQSRLHRTDHHSSLASVESEICPKHGGHDEPAPQP